MKQLQAWVEKNPFWVGLLLVLFGLGGIGEIYSALKGAALYIGGLLLLLTILSFLFTRLEAWHDRRKPPADLESTSLRPFPTTNSYPVPPRPPVPEMSQAQAEELMQALKESLARKTADREQQLAEIHAKKRPEKGN